jgi:hypothetical protein
MQQNQETRRLALMSALIAGSLLASGCVTMGGKSEGSGSTAAAPAPSGPKIGPGMNERGEVTDPKKVEAGYGQKVKGMDDWEGEITGKLVPGSKFDQLKIGMSHYAATALLGQPSDQGAYMTGKAWIPFYFGSDKYRYEVTYKGKGRLIFAAGAGYAFGDMHLIWIIHSAAETGER